MRIPAVLVALVVVLSACSSDPEVSTCESVQTLNSSLTSLFSADTLTGGTDELKTKLDTVESNVNGLVDAASGQFEPQVKALKDALSNLQTAATDLGDGVSLADTATNIGDALNEALTAYDALLSAVEAELGDCSVSAPATLGTTDAGS